MHRKKASERRLYVHMYCGMFQADYVYACGMLRLSPADCRYEHQCYNITGYQTTSQHDLTLQVYQKVRFSL